MTSVKILLAIYTPELGRLLREDILLPAGYQVTTLNLGEDLDSLPANLFFDLAFIEAGANADLMFSMLEKLLMDDSNREVILIGAPKDKKLMLRALRAGVFDFLILPFQPAEVLDAVQSGLKRREDKQTWTAPETDLKYDSLEHLGLSNPAESGADNGLAAFSNTAGFQASSGLEHHVHDSILTHLDVGVIVVNREGQIVLINPKARSILDLPKDGLSGKSLEDALQNDALLEVIQRDHPEMPYRSEITLEGGYILSTQLVDIPNVGLAVTMQDITYFKEVDRIKTEFVNTISHDLRSPLTAILGYVELITRVGEVNDKQKDFIKRIQISVRNISDLINSLLELGRIESGFDTQKEYFPFNVVVKYALDDLQSQLAEYHHTLKLEISKDLPEAFGDPVRLRQVAYHLISNAVRYTSPGGQIAVRLRAEQDQIIFQVADNGLGIPIPDQAYIFDKFYRASNVPDNLPGSGLGLAIVKSIIETHQGRVWVDSLPGFGSSFTVVLPLQA